MAMLELIHFDLQFAVTVLFGLSLLLGIANNRSHSLGIAILNRWARWLCVSLGIAFIATTMEWTDRPFWALAVIFFLAWLLIETLYTWLAISALSQSALSLFPRFRANDSGEEWPAQAKLIELRDWLRKNGFKKAQALVADVGNDITLRSSIYQDASDTIRAQIVFIPQANGSINHCISFCSEGPDGERFITDNLNTPFGGFYPENWTVHRRPWTRSIAKLLRLHKQCIQDLELQPYEIDPVDDLNQQQGLLERANIEAGFLFPPHMHEEMGRITWEGRYRVWKEVWLLNYFGIACNR